MGMLLVTYDDSKSIVEEELATIAGREHKDDTSAARRRRIRDAIDDFQCDRARRASLLQLAAETDDALAHADSILALEADIREREAAGRVINATLAKHGERLDNLESSFSDENTTSEEVGRYRQPGGAGRASTLLSIFAK